MKRALIKIAVQSVAVLLVYSILLRLLAGSNIVAGIFCPESHLPWHHPLLIGLFVLCRLYVVLLPGLVLSRMGLAWIKERENESART